VLTSMQSIAAAKIRTCDLEITSPALYHTTTLYFFVNISFRSRHMDAMHAKLSARWMSVHLVVL